MKLFISEKSKFRIVRKTKVGYNNNSYVIYYSQYRFLFLWFYFKSVFSYDYGTKICFNTQENAEQYIIDYFKNIRDKKEFEKIKKEKSKQEKIARKKIKLQPEHHIKYINFNLKYQNIK